MSEKNFWELLEEKKPQLTKTASIVANYLIEHPSEAELYSITSLAQACNVADATIYRFCRQLGFEGYNEMKISLAQANAAPPYYSFETLQEGMETSQLLDYSYSCFISAMQDTMSTLDLSAIDKAANLLTNAENVYCFGQGGSLILANDIWVRFSTISSKFQTINDSHLQLMKASLMSEKDVLLFVSYSGATYDMLDILKQAKRNGVRIILITHHADSVGAQMADVVLYCGGYESPLEGGSIPVKVAILFVADILVHRFSLDHIELTRQSRNRTSHAMAPKLM